MKSKINANRALVAKKAKLTKLFTLLTILTLGITNVWGDVLWESDMQETISGVTVTKLNNSDSYVTNLDLAWAPGYTKAYSVSGSNRGVQLTFDTPLSLQKGDIIRVYGGATNNTARTLSLFINDGGSAVGTATLPNSSLRVIDYEVGSATTLNKIKVTSNNGATYIFKVVIFTNRPTTGSTTITYDMEFKLMNVQGRTDNCISTISGLSSAIALSGITSSNSNGVLQFSGQLITIPTSYDASKYVDLQFTVEDGYTFTPTAISLKWAGTSNNFRAKASVLDGTTTVESNESAITSTTVSVANAKDITFSSGAFDGKSFSGTVHIRVNIWGAANRAYLLSPLTITGTVASAVPVTKYTVTYDLNGGTGTTPTQADVAEGGKFTLHDGTTDITAPENKEFAGWNDGTTTFNGGAEYTMGSSNVTLTAQWQNIATKYAITYDLNGASGDAPTEASKAAGAEFTLAAAPSRDGYRFDGWLCSADGLVKDAEANYTMTAAATTFTAQWTQLFTVTYYNGAVSLGTEQVANGGSPANYGSFQTLPLASFVGWYSDQELNTAIADVSALTISANTPIYGKWSKGYAVTIDLATEAAGDKTAINDFFASKGYASTIGGSGGYDTNASGYLGYKFKNNGDEILFNLQNGKIADIAFMYIETNFKIYVDGVEFETVTNKSTSATPLVKYVYANGADKLVRIVNGSANSKTSVINKIAIHDPYVVTYDATTNGGDAVTPGSATYIGTALTLPGAVKGSDTFIGWFDAETGGSKIGEEGDSYTPTASITLYAQFESISTDARLSAIEFSSAAGTLSPAFNMEVTEYTYTMPYGTAAIPTITGATAHHANAQAPIIGEAAAAWGGSQTIQGVAESGDKKTYTVTMLKAPKDGVCLVWGDIPSNNTITYNATNSKVYKAADVTLATTVSGKDGAAPSGVKFQNNSYVKVALNEGTFKAGDVLALDVTYGTANKMYVYNAQDAAAENVIGELDGTTTPAGVNKVAITDDAAELWLVRAGQSSSWNPHVDYVAVYRIMNPMLTAITINGEAGVIDESLKTVAVELQPGYDLAALTIVPTIVSNTAEASVVKTVTSNGGEWIIGDNTYRLTDKDGDYTEYTVTLSVGEVKHTVSFNTHGGSTIDDVQVVDGQKLAAAPADPTKEDYLFQGWSEAADGSIVDVTSFTITADKVFHAIWASDGAIKLLDGATVNHTNFITGVTADETVEFMGNTVNYAKFAGTCGNVNNVKDLTKSIIYNATTNKTKIQISAHNNSTSGRNIYVIGLVEGASEAVELANISLGNKEDKVSDWIEFDNAANRTIYIMVPSSAGDVYFTQVKVIESGETPMKQAGETGYSLNFNKGRFFGIKDNIIAFEGLNVGIASSDCQPLNTSIVKLNNTSMSFTVASAMTLSVTTNNNKTYYVTEGAAGTDNETAKAGVSEFNLTAGTWYITAGASNVEITNIAFSQPTCPEAVLPSFVGAYCEGGSIPTLDATATNDLTDYSVAYSWFAADAPETELANVATFTPTADGDYKVKVTVSKAGYLDAIVTSDAITVAVTPAIAITMDDLSAHASDAVALTVNVTAGVPTAYAWYTCDDELGTNPVLIAAAEAASYNIPTPVVEQYYKVVVSGVCGGDVSAVAHVTLLPDYTRVDVTESTTWDWTKASEETTVNMPEVNVETLLANVPGIHNDANFNSQALLVTGQYAKRDGGGNIAFQGTTVRFYVTKPGKVTITARRASGTGSMDVSLNGTVVLDDLTSTKKTSKAIFVPAGWVTIEESDNNNQMRLYEIVFNATPDYKRDASTGDDWMAPGELGTVCIPNGAVATGGELYTLEGKNSDGKIVFATVPNNRMTPGVPYLFQATSNAMNFFYTDEDVATDPDNSGAMKSTFEDGVVLSGDDLINVYYFNGHALWNAAALTELPVVKYRAYVKMDEVYDIKTSNPAPGRRYIIMDVHGQNATTGFGEVQGDDVQCTKVLINGQLFILRGEKMYNANGQLVK